VIDPTSDLGRKVAAASRRLRVLHAELADESPEIRREQLNAELSSAASGLAPSEKRPFLEALALEFPVWSVGEQAPSPAMSDNGVGNEKLIAEVKAAQAETAALKAQMADPWATADRLRQSIAQMDAGAKARMAKLLADAGLTLPAVAGEGSGGGGGGGGGLDPNTERELKAKLQMAATQNVKGGRLVELQMLLTDFITSLDQFGWAGWQRLAPQSKYKRLGPIVPTMGKFVAGDPQVPAAELEKNLMHLRKLILALIAAASKVGRQHGQRYLAKYAVPAIEASVKVGLMGNKQASCWQKYTELMQGVEEATVEAEINAIITEEVEKLLGLR
jgi:hypothetical protein